MVEAALLNWSLEQIMRLVLIVTRVGPLLFLMPVLGSRGVPSQVKILLTLMTSLVLLPVVPVTVEQFPATAVGFVVLALCEVAFAGILSLFVRFLFGAVETAGQMVSIQMGMGMAGTIDPQFGSQVSPVGMFWNVVAILIFLAVDGHHLFFRTLVESYQWVAPGSLAITQATFDGMMQGASRMFVLAVQIMAPASAALFFSHVAMGIIAKTVPQIPILIVGMPLNIAVGLIFVGLSLGYFLPLMVTNYEMLGRLLPQLARGMGG
ncbi:MAG: flagellar biosynthetic protein FliR [Thermodesulfobacteriota bacterium]